MKESALIIFVKNPEPGKVKTRLAKTIGDLKALLIYKELLRHTVHITQNLSCNKYVFYEDSVNRNDLWLNVSYHKCLQNGKDLGERMLNAFSEVIQQGYKKVVIIGSDCYELNTEILLEAFRKLDSRKIVLGPAIDGGYYLLGLRSLISQIFIAIPWSTEKVLTRTLFILNQCQMDYDLLPELRDIDKDTDLTEDLKIEAGIYHISEGNEVA